MPNVALANTSTNLSGKTAVLAEVDQTITGLQTFSRAVGQPPFAVGPGAGGVTVANLRAESAVSAGGADYATSAGNADNLDGVDGALYARKTDLPYVVGGALPTPVRLGSSYTNLAMPAGTYNNFNPNGVGQNHVLWIAGPTAAGVIINSVLAEAQGTMHVLFNESGYVLTLVNNAAGAGNGRLVCPTFVDLAMPAVSGVTILYSAYFNGWIVLRG
jgi:hypothetical protein